MAVDDATGPQLSNEMTDDQRAKLTFQHKEKYQRLLASKKEHAANLLNFTKEIKSDLGAKGLEDIKDMLEAESPEGELRLKEAMERRARVMRWMAIPIGTQVELFPAEDRRPLSERAFAQGKKAGLAGDPYSNPYHQTNVDGHGAFNSGFQEGQGVLMKGIGKLEPDGAIDSLAPAAV